jgi:hypothetical protein
VTRDRSDYSASVAESWKRQMLLNVVGFGTAIPPVFLDVGHIVSSDTVQSTFTVAEPEPM